MGEQSGDHPTTPRPAKRAAAGAFSNCGRRVKQRVFDHGTVGPVISNCLQWRPPIDQKQVVVVPFLVQETGRLATGHSG